jgi:hypothetical protein
MRKGPAFTGKGLLIAVMTLPIAATPRLAFADPGAFPEAPGGNVQNACAAVASAPAVGGGTSNNPIAFGIINGLFADACGGG